MSEVRSPKFKVENASEIDDFQFTDGELSDIAAVSEIEKSDDEQVAKVSAKAENHKLEIINQESAISSQQSTVIYIFAPLIFLTVALLGGLRLSDPANDFLFLRPALICLIFAAITLILFFRARLIKFDGWFSESFSTLKNTANAAVLIALFAASVQIFNSLLPERGLPFWVVGFCFFWTLWNNLFAEFETKKLLKSLGAMFALAFVVKYLLLANLTAPTSENWFSDLIKNPAQSAFSWALDLPRFAAGTDYIQFFTLVFYLIGLFLLPDSTDKAASNMSD